MKQSFVIERQGKPFVLYAGLLDAAHEAGLQSIRTQLLQVPDDSNDQTAITFATVEMKDGRVFTGIGDASPRNVPRPMVEMIIRFAETRAKARALRDAINVGMVSLEELGNDEDSAPQHRPGPRRPTPITNGQRDANGTTSADTEEERTQKLRDKWARLAEIGAQVGVTMPDMPADYERAYTAVQDWWTVIQDAQHPAQATATRDEDLPF